MPARGKGRGRGKGKSGKSPAKGEGHEEVVEEPIVELEPSDVAEEESDIGTEESEDQKASAIDESSEAPNNGSATTDGSATVEDTAASKNLDTESLAKQENVENDPDQAKVNQNEAEMSETTIPKPTVIPDQSDQNQDNQESNTSDSQGELSKLTSQGITTAVANEICKLIQEGSIANSDINEEILSCLKGFPEDKISNAVKEFSEADVTDIKDKSTHLLSILKVWMDDKVPESSPSSGPNEAKIKALLEQTGYSHEVTSGQRHYGPPANWEGGPPGHDTEIFVGKLPWDVYEDELVPLFEECGKLYEIRIMINPNTGANRGFAFVRYVEKDAVKQALEKFHDHEIRPGKKLKLNESNPKKRLFVGNVPKTKSKEEIMEEFSKHTENLTDVIIYINPDDAGSERKNRGFCFLDYASHADAAEAKKTISKKGFRAFESDTFVDWADRIEENDDSVMSEVKNLYVRNLSSDVTEEMLKNKFSEFGQLEKVKRIKDYAFIHFIEREHALKALEAMKNYTGLGKCALEVSLARPVTDKVKQKREQKKWEHQVQRMQRLGGVGSGGGIGSGIGIGSALGVGGAGYGYGASSWGHLPQYGASAWSHHPSLASPYAYDYGYARSLHHLGWDYGQPYGARTQYAAGFRSRGIGFPRGFPGYGQGPRGYGHSHRHGGHAGSRGGAMKRKAQDPPDASNGANDAKRPVGQQAAAASAAPAAAADSTAEQDWTSDVNATW